jgi:hypothetical protein
MMRTTIGTYIYNNFVDNSLPIKIKRQHLYGFTKVCLRLINDNPNVIVKSLECEMHYMKIFLITFL